MLKFSDKHSFNKKRHVKGFSAERAKVYYRIYRNFSTSISAYPHLLAVMPRISEKEKRRRELWALFL